MTIDCVRGAMKKKIKIQLIDLVRILIGNACIAFAVNTLILENGIICGGVSGIASAAEYYFQIPISFVVAILNIGFF